VVSRWFTRIFDDDATPEYGTGWSAEHAARATQRAKAAVRRGKFEVRI